MPTWFNNINNRTERILSVFTSLDHLPNLRDGLNISVRALYYLPKFDVVINEEQLELPNFNMYFEVLDNFDDVKFESSSNWMVHYGFESKDLLMRI